MELEPACVTALGHEEDETLLDKVADKVISTPTALGTYLRDLVEEAHAIDTRAKEAVRAETTKEFEQKLKDETARLEREYKSSRGVPGWVVLVAVILGIVLGILLNRLL